MALLGLARGASGPFRAFALCAPWRAWSPVPLCGLGLLLARLREGPPLGAPATVCPVHSVWDAIAALSRARCPSEVRGAPPYVIPHGKPGLGAATGITAGKGPLGTPGLAQPHHTNIHQQLIMNS